MSASQFAAAPLGPGSFLAPRATLATLAFGTLALGLLFHREAAAAVATWLRSTAFSHCFVVLPVAAWLAWERRAAIRGTAPHPLPWAALAALPVGLIWFVMEQVGVMEGRQLTAIALVEVLAFAVMGTQWYRAMAAPLLYLVFLVPFGAFLTPALQSITVRFITLGLDLAGVPYVANATLIEVPEGRFLVAEACAGLRFLIASIAFGAVFACTFYRSMGRRLAFLTASAVVPVIANGLRALGLVLLGHSLGSAQAAMVDHVLYGWLFFSFVTLLLVTAGLTFREDLAPPSSSLLRPCSAARRGLGWQAVAAGIGTVLLAAAGPAASGLLDRQQAAIVEAADPALVTHLLDMVVPGPGCGPLEPGRDPATRRFACGTTILAVRLQSFPPQISPARLIALATADQAGPDAEPTHAPTLAGWNLTWAEAAHRVVAQGLWIGGKMLGTGLSARLTQARAVFGGGGRAPILLTITADPVNDGWTDSIASFVAAQHPLLAALSVD